MTTTPNMTTISALERSLQNCSLSRSTTSTTRHGDGVDPSSATAVDSHQDTTNLDAALELNSHLALPCQWEQCLDLQSGEIYYVNWETGMKEKEDPRKINEKLSGNYYYEVVEEVEENTYTSDDSSSASSPSPSSNKEDYGVEEQGDQILIVAGCKSCLMYFMLPKWVQVCPKCNGFILHFDRFKKQTL